MPKLMNSLNWIGLVALIIGCVCFSVITNKRSACWGPAKSVLDELDLFDKRFAKIGIICILLSLIFFLIANI